MKRISRLINGPTSFEGIKAMSIVNGLGQTKVEKRIG